MTSVADELLAAVDRSPEAAGVHDREGWLSLFSDDARIEDPYGSRPHDGRAHIERFYDTFIAPRQLTFHKDFDIVAGTTVVRDVTIEVGMGPGLTLMVPNLIRYDLRESPHGWQITRLRAYWELPVMIRQFVARGPAALPVLTRLGLSMVRNQGVAGTMGFSAGMRGVGTRGKRLVEQHLTRGDDTVTKIIAAGDTVAATVTGPAGRRIVFTECARHGMTIERTDEFGPAH